MPASVESWNRKRLGRNDLSDSQEDIIRSEVTLPLIFRIVLGPTVKFASGIINSLIYL